MNTQLLLMRHGQTEWSRDDRFTGVSDISLTDEGRRQAAALAERLAAQPKKLAALYSSPKIRSRETAEIIAKHLQMEVVVVPDLQELDYGVWEGLPREEIVTRYADEFSHWASDPAVYAPPDGETGLALVQRVRPALEQLLAQHQGQIMAVVAHKTVNRLAICSFLGIPLARYRQIIKQSTACLNLLSFEAQDRAALAKLNDITHYEPSIW